MGTKESVMRSSLLIVMSVFAVACGSESQPTETAQTSNEQRTAGGEGDTAAQAAMAACPMQVQGTTVQAESIDGGAAMVFVTTGDVDALRERVRNMAVMHESHAMRGHAHDMEMTETRRPGSADDPAAGAKIGDADDGVSAGGLPQSDMPVDVDTRVEDIEGGARLVMIATDASDVDALRNHTEQHAQAMSGGECPMAPHSMQSSGTYVQ
jgi:hypothetical protein